MDKNLVIGLAGNPNCGKTSTFNALTGAKQHVGNWPGVTVEKKEGKMKYKGREITVVDLPGAYSMGAYSEDEVVARDFILNDKPDVIINVIDSCNIERNLYLTLQLIETGVKVVLALNMTDEAQKKEIEIDEKKLSEIFKTPVIKISAVKNKGLDDLIEEAIKIGDSDKKFSYSIDYGSEVDKEIFKVEEILKKHKTSLKYPISWTALKLLESDAHVFKSVIGDNNSLKDEINSSIDNLSKSINYEADAFIVDKRYEAITDIVKRAVKKGIGNEVQNETISDKIDKVVTNKWLGIPIFLLIMFGLYQFTITFGNNFLGGFVGDTFDSFSDAAGGFFKSVGTPDILSSFITDGLINGLGTILGFVPMIFTMFILISILEDSGYMARAAYVMDKIMTAIGLHGKTAVSLIIGSGCNVAGIMSTRTIESKKDRMIAILISPFISCPARLVIYAIFISAFFSKETIGPFNAGGFIIFLLYVLGIVVAILVGKFLSKFVFEKEESYFVMELPPYRLPTIKGVLIHMWEKGGSYVKKAGTVIFGTVVVVWVLSNLPAGVDPGSKNSLIGIVGSIIAPIFKIAGFGTWQAGAALIAGFAAKESVVGTMATLYGAAEGPKLVHALQGAFTPLSAISFMVMSLLYVPCVATMGAIKRETNSNKWAIISAVASCVIGWFGAVITYQIGMMMGF